MNFNWQDYLSLADELKVNADNSQYQEASLRTSISRSYYAAFCIARNYLREHRGIQFNGIPEDHEIVRLNFQTPEFQKISVDLNRLRRNRNQADYDDEITCSLVNTATFSITMAHNIIDSLVG